MEAAEFAGENSSSATSPTIETIAEMVMLNDALPKGARGPWGRPAGA
jgi:hypothetical protein